jgi:hypothetical protein
MKKMYWIAFPYSFRIRLTNTKRQFQKLAELWKVTPADCRGQLLTEFVLRPVDFENRFAEEVEFQLNTAMRWR